MIPVIGAEQAAWMQSGITSIVVASRNERNRPSVGLAFGCRVNETRDRIVVFLLEAQSHDLLCDLRSGRQVSVLFTQSVTTRALQLKAPTAREVPIAAGDAALLAAYTDSLVKEWGAVALSEAYTRALMSRDGDALVAFELSPEAAFDQTPGPRAGSPLGAGT